MRTTVAIVGGGIAGLYAARLLGDAEIDYRLLEARDRLGGRILSVDASGKPSHDGFDLGPSWYWPMAQPALGALTETLQLDTFPQCSDGDIMFERMSRERPHRYRQVQNEGGSTRIAGGTDTLVRAIVKAIPPQAIMTGTRVTRIGITDGAVRLDYVDQGGISQIMEARQVILALPPRLLEATIAFDPPLNPTVRTRWRSTPTWMAPHAKFFALYDRPFWRDDGLCGTAQSMVGPLVEIHDATTASGSAALFGFLGWGADQRATIGKDELSRACLSQLARLFGEKAAHPRATLYKDWAADPLTATADDRVGGNHPESDEAAWVTGEWQGYIALGGSETADREPGYLAGAIQAAKRAVNEVVQRLE